MAKMQAFNAGFGIDQLIAASEAARNFSGLRKSAKMAPRLILENNKPDSVLLSIEDYQFIQEAIAMLQEEIVELKTAERIRMAEANGVKKHDFKDFATDEDKEIYRKAANWDISDDELFE